MRKFNSPLYTAVHYLHVTQQSNILRERDDGKTALFGLVDFNLAFELLCNQSTLLRASVAQRVERRWRGQQRRGRFLSRVKCKKRQGDLEIVGAEYVEGQLLRAKKRYRAHWPLN